jgi:hypothetical protein
MIFENNLGHWAYKIMQIILGHMYEDYDLKYVKLRGDTFTNKQTSLQVLKPHFTMPQG